MLKKILLAAVPVLCLLPADAKTIYVSNAGNDKNPGSAKAPFKTIAFAARKALPGDTVKILPGLYREQIQFTRSGKKAPPSLLPEQEAKRGNS